MNSGLPFAISANVAYETVDDDAFAVVNDNLTGTILAGAELGLSDNLFFFGTVADSDDVNGATLDLGLLEETESLAYRTGAGFSHQFGESNVLLGFIGASGSQVEADTPALGI
jgi:hypothetical protein